MTAPTPPIAPAFPQSRADRAAHRAASHVRARANSPRRAPAEPFSPADIRRLGEDLAWEQHQQSKSAGVAA